MKYSTIIAVTIFSFSLLLGDSAHAANGPKTRSLFSPSPENMFEGTGTDGNPITCALVKNKWIPIRAKRNKFQKVGVRLKEILKQLKGLDAEDDAKLIKKLNKEKKSLKRYQSNAKQTCTAGPIQPTPTPTVIPDEFSMEAYSGPVSEETVRYLLEKAAYGRSSGEQAVVDKALSTGLATAVDELMLVKAEDATLADRIEDRKNASNGVGGGSGLGDLLTQTRDSFRFRGFRQAALELAINTRNPFRENLRHFLLGLWTVGHDVLSNSTAGNPQFVLWWDYFNLLGEIAYNLPLPTDFAQAFPGKSKFAVQLVRAQRSPMMLLWLSNNQNVLGNVNENYARELQELFTVGTQRFDEATGVLVDNYVEFRNGGNRTLGDIYRIARNISGWRVSPFTDGGGIQRWRGVFSPEDHDPAILPIFEGEPHQFSSSSDSEVVFGILEKHPGAPLFISKEILRWYVTAAPPQELIKTFSQVLVANNYDLDASLRTLLLSKAFYHGNYKNTVAKNSFQVAVELARTLEMARHDIGSQTLEVGININQREGTPDQEFVVAYTQGSVARMGYTTTLPSEGVFFFPDANWSRPYTLMETANLTTAYLLGSTELARLVDGNGLGWMPQRVLPEGDYTAAEVIQFVANKLGVTLSNDDVDQLVYYMDYNYNPNNGIQYTRAKYDNLLNGIPSEANGFSNTNHQNNKARYLYVFMAMHPHFLSK